MAEQEIIVHIGANISSFQSAMNTVGNSMSDTASEVENAMDGAESSVQDGAGGIKSALKGLAGIIASAFAVDAIIDFTKNMLEVTSDAQALESQYEQVMGDMKDSTDKYLKEMSKAWNKHPKELKGAYLQYVALLKSKGVAEEESHKLAKQYLERTVDANAFANEDMADTTARFMGAIKGEYDSLDTAMINLSATMLNDMSMEQYGKKFEELTVVQQEQLKVQEAIRQHTSAGVFGQGAKEAESYANNLAMVKNQWNDLLVIMGSPVLLYVQDALKQISTLLTTVKTEGFSNALKTIVPQEFHDSIDLAVKAVGNIGRAFTTTDLGQAGIFLGTGIVQAIQGIQGIGKALGQKISEAFGSEDFLAEVQSGISSVAYVIAKSFNEDLANAIKDGDWSQVSTLLGEVLGDAILSMLENAGKLTGAISDFILTLFDALNWGELGKNAVLHAVDFVFGFVMALLDPMVWFKIIQEHWDDILILLLTFFTGGLSGLLAKIAPALAKIPLAGKFLEWIATSFDNLLAPARGKIGGWFSELWTSVKEGVSKGLSGLIDEGTVIGSWVAKFKGIWGSVSTNFTQNFTILKAKVSTFAESVIKTLGKPFEGFAKIVDTSITKVKGFLDGLWTKAKEIGGLVKDKITNMLTGIKIPKISLNTGTKTIMGKTITYPKGFDISWHKEGGIFNNPSLIGIGESGSEAVIPLNNKSHVRPFAKAVADLMPTNTAPQNALAGEIVVHVHTELDGKELAKNTIRLTQDLLADLTKKQNRLNGMYA